MPIFALLPLSPLRPKARAPGAGKRDPAPRPAAAAPPAAHPAPTRPAPPRPARCVTLRLDTAQGVLGQQEGKQAHHRRGLRPRAGKTGQTRRRGQRQADHLLEKDTDAAGTGWRAAIFTSTSRASQLPRRGTEVRLDAEDLDAGLGQRRQSVALEHHRRAREDAVGEVQCLARCVAADTWSRSVRRETIGPGGTPCSCRHAAAPGAAHAHAVRRLLVELHAGKIADDVRQGVGLRVADLVEHLLAHGATADQSAGASGLVLT
jgi:hypothetical protein